MPPPADQSSRDAAVLERARNVVVDAGAGTGKTTLLVSRLVELVAPSDDDLPALPLPRIAAVTFTRKAAGELKLRVRKALLDLQRDSGSEVRRERLTRALEHLDTAWIGTIHGFADRLLRLYPCAAHLSPSYEVCDDATPLEDETFESLLRAADHGTLEALLGDGAPADLVRETESTIAASLRAGVSAEDRKFQFGSVPGLRGLVGSFLASRDHVPPLPALDEPEFPAFRAAVAEYLERATGVGNGPIGRWLKASARQLSEVRDSDDFFTVLPAVLRCVRTEPDRPRKGDEGDDRAWNAWKFWDDPPARNPERQRPLRDDLTAPIFRHLALRLARTQPVVLALYEQVKTRHRQVDQVDLLLRLRDVLLDPRIRAQAQALFDHLFVDEFQDTDPLQAEILLFLCEDGTTARTWKDVEVAPGRLTLVGDPKQSIYRFRRADVAMYAAVRDRVMRRPHLHARLTTNFRSDPRLIELFNRRFDDLLGSSPGSAVFDPEAGTVCNERLVAGTPPGATYPRLRVVPYQPRKTTRAGARTFEARVLARYLRSLIEDERPLLGPEQRPAKWSDVAVLALTTTALQRLFDELDQLHLPYSSRGGKLFLSDPLHRQFLLGLRALADKDDGVALAALLRPPFFGVDPADLARERAVAKSPQLVLDAEAKESVARAQAVRELVSDLRRRRFERSPGATARDLLERTAFARAAALGPNGAQRVARLRDLCLAFEQVAARDGLDFDAATQVVRGWIDDPAAMDAPPPLGEDALQVMTVHQAKGLEFPVVVLWDAEAELVAQEGRRCWQVDREGAGWVLRVDVVTWEEPRLSNLVAIEKEFLDAERLRHAYVAATRARDLLVVPQVGTVPNLKKLWGNLVETVRKDLVHVHPEWNETVTPPPAWGRYVARAKTAAPDASSLAVELDAQWTKARDQALVPRLAPSSVTRLAHEGRADDEESDDPPRPRGRRASRFGPVFGDTVHGAIGLCLEEPALEIGVAVARAAKALGLTEHEREAVADVERALATLKQLGLRRRPDPTLQLEYPVAQATGEALIVGYVDLLALLPDDLVVLDFKTDAVPQAGPPPEYAAQVHGYARMLEAAGLAGKRTLRCGLLYTADGNVRWL